jgi:ABC-type lipoprotein release transport system permease subunit
MSDSVSVTYAMRSLRRHLRRTILSVLGIGVGCGLCLFSIAFVRGEKQMMIRAAAESGAGHLSVVPPEWVGTRNNDLRLDHWRRHRDRIEGMGSVRVVTPRAEADGLLAFGTWLTAVVMTGVDAVTEPVANRLAQKVAEGRYLEPGEEGAAVIGRAVARRLDVGLDDDLMVTVAGKGGQMNAAMLRVVGIVETGSDEIDSTICHVSLEELERLTGRAGATRLTVLLEDAKVLSRMEGVFQEALGEDVAVLAWDELMPDMAAGVEGDETWARMIVLIIMTVVFLGIASAQLAAVLERRREFAVLAALGMRTVRLVRVLVLEGTILGLSGAFLGLGLGLPAAWWVATRGIDFSAVWGEDVSMSNVLFDPVFYSDFGWYLVPLAFALALISTVLSSLYPAWYAARTDPAAALRVDR